MKKVFNLSVILAVLMAAFSFTSCSDDEDNATVEITLDNNGAFKAGAAATGSINAEAEIESITLFTVKGGAENSMAQQSAQMTEAAKGETAYAFRIERLAIGTYKLSVTDGDGNISSVTFNVGGEVKTFTLQIGGADNTTVGSYISIKDQKVYKASEANANAEAIEIVFDGTVFKSAKNSGNTAFTPKVGATVTMTTTGCTFDTETGYKGTITTDEALGNTSKTYTVTVTKTAK